MSPNQFGFPTLSHLSLLPDQELLTWQELRTIFDWINLQMEGQDEAKKQYVLGVLVHRWGHWLNLRQLKDEEGILEPYLYGPEADQQAADGTYDDMLRSFEALWKREAAETVATTRTLGQQQAAAAAAFADPRTRRVQEELLRQRALASIKAQSPWVIKKKNNQTGAGEERKAEG